MKKQLFVLVLSFMATFPLWASDTQVDGIYYNFDIATQTAEVTCRGDGSPNNPFLETYSGAVVIPSMVTYEEITYRVTSIGSNAFGHCTGLTSIAIPEGITSIGRGAFSYCVRLLSITIPESVIYIAEYAFSGCQGLAEVYNKSSLDIVKGAETHGGIAYYAVNVYTEEGGSKMAVVDDFVFVDDVLVVYRGTATDISLPTSYRDGNYSIGYAAFASSCSGLTSVTLPEGIVSIANFAFGNCSSLTSIVIPKSVISIHETAFYNCSGLISILVKDGNTVYDSRNNCNALIETATITLLKGCNNTIIPAGVISIGDGAFYYCSGLTSVIIPNSVTSVGDEAFSGCSGLTSVTIGNSVTSIGDNAFSGCSGLTSVIIPNNVTSVGDEAFSGCSGLTSVTIGNSVTSIGYATFSDCRGLTSVTIPNSVTSIGDRAFFGCRGLTSVTIPNSVTSIGYRAFFSCRGLTSVTIGNSVTNIGDNAFFIGSGLISIISYAMIPPRCLSDVFRASEDVVVYVPCTALADYKQAEGWNAFANIQCITSEEVETSDNSIIVTPSESEVTFTWPSNSNANAYTLEITKDGVVFCTLTFNANGQLMTIAFAPSKDRNNAHAPQAAQATVNGWQFTVTGLNEGSNYAYTMTVTDNSGTELQTYNGTFRTLGTTALDNINAADAAPVQKILRNGQVFILRGNEVYTVTGQKVAE